MLFLIGFGMAHPELKRGLAMIGACFIVLCIVGVLLNLRASRKYQRQIDELDSQGEQG
jgi:hypothetical protein